MSAMSREVMKALKRLEKSRTRLTRRRARIALRSVYEAVLKKYPALSRDGKEKAKAKQPTCPVCGIPVRNWLALARHIWRKHCRDAVDPLERYIGFFRCPVCGGHDEGHRDGRFLTKAGVGMHLAGLARAGKLHSHILGKAFEGHLPKRTK